MCAASRVCSAVAAAGGDDDGVETLFSPSSLLRAVRRRERRSAYVTVGRGPPAELRRKKKTHKAVLHRSLFRLPLAGCSAVFVENPNPSLSATFFRTGSRHRVFTWCFFFSPRKARRYLSLLPPPPHTHTHIRTLDSHFRE
jgi:hypothetical protein